jgi:hypothetical protein
MKINNGRERVKRSEYKRMAVNKEKCEETGCLKLIELPWMRLRHVEWIFCVLLGALCYSTLDININSSNRSTELSISSTWLIQEPPRLCTYNFSCRGDYWAKKYLRVCSKFLMPQIAAIELSHWITESSRRHSGSYARCEQKYLNKRKFIRRKIFRLFMNRGESQNASHDTYLQQLSSAALADLYLDSRLAQLVSFAVPRSKYFEFRAFSDFAALRANSRIFVLIN